MEGIFFAENPFPIMSYLPVELNVVYRAKNSINFSTDKLAGGVDYFKNFQTHIPQMTKVQIGNVFIMQKILDTMWVLISGKI